MAFKITRLKGNINDKLKAVSRLEHGFTKSDFNKMPRTKQVKKKSSVAKKQKHSRTLSSNESFAQMSDNDTAVATLVSNDYESIEEFVQEFEKFYEKRKQDLKKGYEKACELVKKEISELVESSTEDQNTDPNKTPSPKVRQSRARKPVETFDFKRPRTPKASRLASSSRSSSRKRSASASASATHREPFKTPVLNGRIPSCATITPKIYSNTPISVMRRPLHGEVAVSMSGSPLMVGAVSNEDVPTVNVPLHDGRVFSIMPEAGAPPLDMPEIDAATKKYLQTLRKHLAILAPSTP